MAPDKTPSLALLMSNGLGPRLRMALVESLKFSLVAKSEITVKMFLVSLYKSSPAEVGFFFSGTAPLERLLQELSSIDVSVHEIAPARNRGDRPTGPSTTLDVKLTDLLVQAAEARRGQEKVSVEIADFMRVLSNDAETVAFLRNDLGLNFKSRPA
jgi:hypothetical protein